MPTRSFCAAHCHLTAALAAPPCPLPQYRPWYNTILWNTSGCCDMYNNQFWSMMRALFGYTGESRLPGTCWVAHAGWWRAGGGAGGQATTRRLGCVVGAAALNIAAVACSLAGPFVLHA